MKLINPIMDGAALCVMIVVIGAVLVGCLITRSVMWVIGRGWNFEESSIWRHGFGNG